MPCTPTTPRRAGSWRTNRPTTSSPSRTTSPSSRKTSSASAWRHFPPEHVTIEKAHGRIETRRIWTSTRLTGYVQFAHAAQVACIEREVHHLRRNATTTERAYLITSLAPEQANAERLLAINRGHWSIENRLHYVRDMAYAEDRCRARTGHTARTLACLRNFAISVLRLFNVSNITAALRDLAAQPRSALAMLRL